MLIEKYTKNKKWENDWRNVVKRMAKVLNDKDKIKQVDDYAEKKKELENLQTALKEKEDQFKKKTEKLKKVQESLKTEKTYFSPGGKKKGWETQYNAFKNNWQGDGWTKKAKAHYPSTGKLKYTDNLYSVKDQSFKITEDQANKILAKVIYEIGRIDRTEFVNNHGITDPDLKNAIEKTFDQIQCCSKEIEAINSKGSSTEVITIVKEDGTTENINKPWKDRVKTWDLPFTYSVEQKVIDATGKNTTNPIQSRYDATNPHAIETNSLVQNISNFIDQGLKDEVIDKLTKLDDITKTHQSSGSGDTKTDFDIYQAGDAYDDETLKNLGIEVSDENITTLYRTIKWDNAQKKWINTDKMPINIQNGLKDWIKLFKSVFSDLKTCQRLEKGLKIDDNPNYLLFNDLRSQLGTEDPFTQGGSNYRLYENLDGVIEAETTFTLEQSKENENLLELKNEINKKNRDIAQKSADYREVRASVEKTVEDTLVIKENKLKTYNLKKGVDDPNNKRSWIERRKIQKLILEIRYLQNEGDTTRECDFETKTGNPNYCKGLVGIIDVASLDASGELKEVELYKDKDGNSVMGFKTTAGTLDQTFIREDGNSERFYLVKYFEELAWDKNTKKHIIEQAINKIKNGEDELLSDLKTKDKFENFWKHFEGISKIEELRGWKLEAQQAIDKELGKTNETTQQWREKMKEIDPSLDDTSLINDAWKDKWTALKNFKEIAKVEALFNKVKDKTDFLTELPTISGETGLNTLKAMAAKEPKKIIGYIEKYWYNHLKDDAEKEEDKEKTQMKRRIAKALGKNKESDITDKQIIEALVKIQIGELTTVEMSKFYDANLKEISTKNPPNEEQNNKPFLRWNNPWLYVIGLTITGIICTVIWWDKITKWFKEDGNEEQKQK